MTFRVALIVLIAVLLLGAGYLLWSNSPSRSVSGEPTSPVLVDIITPANGISVSKGETFSILAQAWSPNPVTTMELWEDGQMISSENLQNQSAPVNYSWDLDPSELGVHTYYVRALDSESEQGQSQTLILNIAPGGYQQISAAEGDTLAGISEQTSFAVGDVAALNPALDPSQPLGDGQPVILPPSSEDGGKNIPADAGIPDMVIQWQFSPKTDVDNSYCYQSIGGEKWQRAPNLPFSFLPGGEWLQTSIALPTVQQFELFLECWGWNSGQLVYLGEGQTSLDFAQIPSELIIAASGFEAQGLPEMKPLEGDIPEGEIPAPFALREAESVSECVSHYGGNPSATDICSGLISASTKQYIVLVWEWSPGFCWGSCPWGDGIDGFVINQSDPYNYGDAISKDIASAQQKVAAFSLPWGSRCYDVFAYADIVGQGRVYSPPATYCGTPPEPEIQILTPQQWISAEGDLYKIGCSTYGELSSFLPSDKQLYVGSGFVNRPLICQKEFDGTAAVKFDLGQVGPDFEMTIQRATLRVSQLDVDYFGGSNVALGNYTPSSCVTRVGVATSDWTGLSGSHFVEHNNLLRKDFIPAAGGASSWLPEGGFGSDMTSAVMEWIQDPASNHGIVLATTKSDLFNRHVVEPNWDAGGCFSLIEVALEIRYFKPPN